MTREAKATDETDYLGFHDFVSHDAIAAAPGVFLPNGELSFFATLTVHGAPLAAKKKSVIIMPAVPVLPPSSLVADIGALLHRGPPGDVVLLCADGERVTAHSLLLSARSTVLAALLGRMDGKAELLHGAINSATVRRMLEFVYTDELVPACVEEAGHLLNAADHFHLPRLLTICERFLADGIDVSNAALTLTLAHQHNVHALKHAAMQFLLARAGAVTQSAGWAHLRASHPALIEEASTALVGSAEPPHSEEAACGRAGGEEAVGGK